MLARVGGYLSFKLYLPGGGFACMPAVCLLLWWDVSQNSSKNYWDIHLLSIGDPLCHSQCEKNFTLVFIVGSCGIVVIAMQCWQELAAI